MLLLFLFLPFCIIKDSRRYFHFYLYVGSKKKRIICIQKYKIKKWKKREGKKMWDLKKEKTYFGHAIIMTKFCLVWLANWKPVNPEKQAFDFFFSDEKVICREREEKRFRSASTCDLSPFRVDSFLFESG